MKLSEQEMRGTLISLSLLRFCDRSFEGIDFGQKQNLNFSWSQPVQVWSHSIIQPASVVELAVVVGVPPRQPWGVGTVTVTVTD